MPSHADATFTPHRRLAFETLLADLSSRFINVAPDAVGREIDAVQRRVCELLDVDLSALWEGNAAEGLTLTHFYSAQEGLLRPMVGMRAREWFPWLEHEMLANRDVVAATLDYLPDAAAIDRDNLATFGVQSNVTVPLSVGGAEPVGALGFNTTRGRREWPDTLVTRLKLVAQILANALARRRADERLRESDARLMLAVDSAEAGLWDLDYRTGVFWASDRTRTIFGLSPDETITLATFEALLHPDDRARVLGQVSRPDAGLLGLEFRITTAGDAAARWILSRGRPHFTPAGEAVRLTGVSIDITDRKVAERQLGDSEALNRATFEQAAVGIAHVGIDGRWLRVNDKLCDILGYSREELLPLAFQDVTYPPDLQTDLEQVRSILSGDIKTYSMDKRYVRRDGTLVWTNLTVSLVRAANGEPRHFISVLEDISERKRHEHALRVGEARLEAGAELAGLAFYEIDYAGRSTYIDARFRALFGVPPDREEGLQPVEFWLDHLHPDDRPRIAASREKLHAGLIDRLVEEYRYLNPERGLLWLHHVARVASRDASGRPATTTGVLRDITQRRQAEEALRRSYDEIERLKDKLQAETDYLRAEIGVALSQGELTGKSPVMKQVLRVVQQVAPTDSTVLVRGETGTGKELVARAIHRLSPRNARVMVKVNCGALPSGLVESELFGREKGAFTGALTRQVGRFELADHSTIFLDEIGDLPPDVQVKLLRVLQEGEFERLGSPRTIKVNVRVIAATNRDLAEEVRTGRFREDLFYRLNVFPIRVPPLRERQEDIPALVWTFLEEFSSRMGKKITQVPRRTMQLLQQREWPGNVRELRNVIEHAAIVTAGDTLMVPLADAAAPAVAATSQTLADAQRQQILKVLEKTRWRIKGPKGAAVLLGLKPSTLYGRMKALGVALPGAGSEDAR